MGTEIASDSVELAIGDYRVATMEAFSSDKSKMSLLDMRFRSHSISSTNLELGSRAVEDNSLIGKRIRLIDTDNTYVIFVTIFNQIDSPQLSSQPG